MPTHVHALVEQIAGPPLASVVQAWKSFTAKEVHAALEAAHVPGLLRVQVTDDGIGGARVEAHGGLAGLAERVRTVDGRLRLSSPPGGPTTVTVELPSHA